MVLRREHGGHGRQFGHAVGLKEADPRELRHGLPKQRLRHGGRAIGQELQGRKVRGRQGRLTHQPGEHGRYDDGDGDPFPFQGLQEGAGLEARNHHMATAGEGGGEDARTAGDVEHGGDVEVHTIVPNIHVEHRREGIRQNVVMAQHDALGAPRGAPGIEQAGEVVLPRALISEPGRLGHSVEAFPAFRGRACIGKEAMG